MLMRQHLIADPHCLNRDKAARAGDHRAFRKARCSADKKVNWSDMMGLDLGKVAEKGGEVLAGLPAMVVIDRHSAEAVLQDGARELVDLADAGAFPAKGFPSDARRFDPAAHTEDAESHAAPRKDSAPSVR